MDPGKSIPTLMDWTQLYRKSFDLVMYCQGSTVRTGRVYGTAGLA